MKKRMIAIAVCSLLMLTACNKSTETVTETADTTAAAVSSETTTAEIIDETSATSAETTAAETTAQSEEKTLSAEELEKQIAAAEELLEEMKKEEAAQTADVQYEVFKPFENMYVASMYNDMFPDMGIGYVIHEKSSVINKTYKSGVMFEYNLIVNNEKPQTSVFANEGDTITIEFTYDEDYLKEHYNTIVEETTMTFTAWYPDENSEFMYVENGQICYTNDDNELW